MGCYFYTFRFRIAFSYENEFDAFVPIDLQILLAFGRCIIRYDE